MTQMQEASALGRIVELVRDLRRRCPWDAAQTPESLRPYLVEEVLELDHALGQGESDSIKVELGDLLLHLAFQIVLGEERGQFGAEDVTRAVEQKMWRRHAHLFPERRGDATAGAQNGRTAAHGSGEAERQGGSSVGQPHSAHEAMQHWERSKLREKTATERGVLDGLPPTLPALLMAYRLQERAAGVGFDWPDSTGPLAKVQEEHVELQRELAASSVQPERVKEEIGDLLFAVVNLSRKLGCDPRAALERANARFAARFRAMERLAERRGVQIGQAGLEQLDRLWEEVKTLRSQE